MAGPSRPPGRGARGDRLAPLAVGSHVGQVSDFVCDDGRDALGQPGRLDGAERLPATVACGPSERSDPRGAAPGPRGRAGPRGTAMWA